MLGHKRELRPGSINRRAIGGLSLFTPCTLFHRRTVPRRWRYERVCPLMSDVAPNIIDDEIKALREQIQAQPGNSRSQAQLGDLLYQKGDLDNAKNRLSVATAINPGLVGSYIQLGNICIRDCEYYRALGCWGVAQTFKPMDYISLKMAVALPPVVENANYIAIMQARLAQSLKYMAEANL